MVRSANPNEQPYIRQNMLGDVRDRVKMREGIRFLAEIAETNFVNDICAYSPSEVNPELFAAVELGDDALDTFMLKFASDTQHGTSTCRMGDPSSATSVVDSDGFVLGVNGLRVIDASIFPSVSLSNTNLTAIMVGEYMADRAQ